MPYIVIANDSEAIFFIAKIAVIVIVNVIVNVKVNDIKKINKKMAFTILQRLAISIHFFKT